MIMVSLIVAPVSAGNVSVTFNQQQAQAKIALSLHQNMTALPNEDVLLDASRDSNISNAIAAALKSQDPSASFTALTVDVKSSADWLNLTVMMNLSGIYNRRGSFADLNMTWKDFSTQTDLRVGNLSYNTVGSRYLRPVVDYYVNASKFETKPNATVQSVNFLASGNNSVSGPDQANLVGNFTVLNFNSLSVPLDDWNRTYSLTNNTTSWRYTPTEILNSTIRVQEVGKAFTLISLFGYDADISVPGLAVAQGNVLRVDVGTGLEEWVMLAVVVVFIGLAGAVQIVYRRRRKALRLGRR
jgi:hypothetical protein